MKFYSYTGGSYEFRIMRACKCWIAKVKIGGVWFPVIYPRGITTVRSDTKKAAQEYLEYAYGVKLKIQKAKR